MKKRHFTVTILAAFAACAPAAFAEDNDMLGNLLGSFLGGGQQQSSDGYNDGYYDDRYDNAIQQDYETLRSRETSVRRSEQQLNDAYRQMEARRAAGQDVTSDQQYISSLQQSYQNDLNQYQRDRYAFQQRRNQLRGQQRSGYRQQRPYQNDEDLQDYYQNLDRSRTSVARSEQQLSDLKNQRAAKLAAGQDTSAEDQAISGMQQSYENDMNQYERDRRMLYRQKNVGRRGFRSSWDEDDPFNRRRNYF